MNSTITHVAIAGVLMLLATPMMNAIPVKLESAQGYLFPVYTDIKAENLGNDYAGNPRFHVKGEKRRDCVLIAEDSFATVKGVTVEIQLVHEDDDDPLSNKPVGLNDFGVWKYRAGGISEVSNVYTIRRNRCGWLWETRTTIGPFYITGHDGVS